MALLTLGSLVLQATSSTQQPQVDTFGDLKTCVAKVVRGESQSKYLEYAGDGIRAGVDDINMRHLFRFGSKRTSIVGLTAGTNTISLAADFYAVRAVHLMAASDSKPYAELQYIPWEQFNQKVSTQNETGVPRFWTARNTFDDETLLMYPTPDAGAATSYNVRTEYYERVDRPTSDTDIIDAPRELSDVLCTYGEYHLLFVLDAKDSTRWGHKYSLYRNKLDAFVGSANSARAQAQRWEIAYESDPNATTFDPLS